LDRLDDVQGVEPFRCSLACIQTQLLEFLLTRPGLLEPGGVRLDTTTGTHGVQLSQNGTRVAQDGDVGAHPSLEVGRINVDAYQLGVLPNRWRLEVADAIVTGSANHQDQVSIRQEARSSCGGTKNPHEFVNRLRDRTSIPYGNDNGNG
jgi:hypothetical protein